MNGLYQPDGLIPFGQSYPPPIDPALQGSPGYAAQGPQAPGGMSQPGGIGGTGPIAPTPAPGAPGGAGSIVPPGWYTGALPNIGAAAPANAVPQATGMNAPAPVAAPTNAAPAHQLSNGAPPPTVAPPSPAGFQVGPLRVTASGRAPVPIPGPPSAPGLGAGAGAASQSRMTPQALQQLIQRFPQLAQRLQSLGQRPSFGLIGANAPQQGRSLLQRPQAPAGNFMQPGGPGGSGPIAAPGYPAANAYGPQQ